MKRLAGTLVALAVALAASAAAAQPAPPGQPIFPPGATPVPAQAAPTPVPAPVAPAPVAPRPIAPANPYPPGYTAPPGYYPAPGYYPPPTGYYPPPAGYYPAPMNVIPPPTLPYEEGQTVPPGYQLKTRSVRKAVIAGAVVFGSIYLTSLLAGATAISIDSSNGSQYAPLFAPVVGPFITIGTAHASGAGTLWLVLDGLGQAAGAATLIYGLAADEKYLQYSGPAAALDVLAHPKLVLGPGSAAVRWTF